MRFTPARLALVATVVLGLTGTATRHRDPVVEYPTGYRQWTHVKSEVIGPGHPAYERFGGLHHIYANEIAMEGYRTGRFRDGAVLVFDLLEVASEGGRIARVRRRFIDVMHRDSARFAASAGWGFEEFRAGSPAERSLSPAQKGACLSCHQGAPTGTLVFSSYEE